MSTCYEDMKGDKNAENGVVMGSYGSFKVTKYSAIRYSAYEFLLTFHSDVKREINKRWDSERELFYDEFAHVLQNTEKENLLRLTN